MNQENKRYSNSLIIIPIILATFLSYPFFNINLGPDSCIYLDIGANLVDGKGFTSSIVNWFAEPLPVPYSALISRQPLFPMFLAGILFFINMYNVVLIKIILFLFYLGSIFLTFKWVQKTEGTKAAFFTSLYLSTNPILNANYTNVLNFSLFVFLLSLIVYLYIQTNEDRWSLLLGLLVGLTYLTRLEGVILFVFFIGINLLTKKWRSLLYFFIAFIITISPLLIARKAKLGGINKSVHSAQYGTLHSPSDVVQNYGVELKTIKELYNYKWEIIKKIGYNVNESV